MRVFVTGASGHIGSAVVSELVGAGHEVVGSARSGAAEKKIRELGAWPGAVRSTTSAGSPGPRPTPMR